MNKKQTGFTALEAVIILFVLAVLGFASWYFIKHRNAGSTGGVSSIFTPAPATNKWVGNTTNYNWSDAANWSLGTPKNRQNLVFDVDSLKYSSNKNLELNDDIKNGSFGSISFTGTKGATFDIIGQPVTVSGGISMNVVATTQVTNGGAEGEIGFRNQVIFNKSQTVEVGTKGSQFNGLEFLNDKKDGVDIGSNAVSFVAGKRDSLSVYSPISGSGELLFPVGSVVGQDNIDFYAGSPEFTGKAVIVSGQVAVGNVAGVNGGVSTANSFGSGPITIEKGGALLLNANGTDSFNLSNPITMGGKGIALTDPQPQPGTPAYAGAINACITKEQEGCDLGTQITLSGQVTLSGDTELGAQYGIESNVKPPSTVATYTFKKPVVGNYSLTTVPDSLVQIVRQ